MQLPLVGLAADLNLRQREPPLVPMVRWADDPAKYKAHWARKNADKMRQYRRDWEARNPEKVRAKREKEKPFQQQQARAYYLRNRRKVIERAVEWKRNNQERANAWQRKHRLGKTAQRTAEMRAYRRRNPHIVRAANKRHYARYADVRRANSRAEYRINRDKHLAYNRQYWRAKKPILLAKKRARHRTDIRYAIECRLRGRLGKAVARRKTAKAASTLTLLGCSLDRFVKHLESQFTDGMSWENRHHWEIDHVRPVASYDLTDPEQQRQCFHWTNLRPLWTDLNRRKSDKII